jgi:hypothetical protein
MWDVGAQVTRMQTSAMHRWRSSEESCTGPHWSPLSVRCCKLSECVAPLNAAGARARCSPSRWTGAARFKSVAVGLAVSTTELRAAFLLE